MKLQGTSDGGLHIHVEDREDRVLLECIATDAAPAAGDLAKELGNLIAAEEIAEDWSEFVTPDLHQAFLSDVEFVARAVKDGLGTDEEIGVIPISRGNGMRWYSALNQARLAMEELYQLSDEEDEPVDSDPLVWMRSQFYCALQTVILEQLLME